MRVLLATDGSPSATAAADLVAAVPWPDGTQIRVVEVIETGAGLFGGPWPTAALIQVDELESALREEAQRTVDAVRERIARPGVTVEGEVARGRAATGIDAAARAMAADLVVVGGRGHGAIESMLLGSVSAEVVETAPAPVLVARGDSLARVVLAWDGSPCAERAAGLLSAWPIFAGASVTVVSVADIEVPWWTGLAEPGVPDLATIYIESAEAACNLHDELASTMAERLRGTGLEAVADRREGDAATQILAAARESNADLIVMGTHGQTGFTRLILGSVARNVLLHAHCSVLVLRDAGERGDAEHPRTGASSPG
jgi:nucleotide-binding universal stress UspA family protein